ncbi:MAG: hypothetical protein IMW94_01645 [Thermoanaerobacter sp.]|nr:hypothetical protein [Thermoanaerobacter sp.]
MEVLPVLASSGDCRIVEVDGQPVVTARDLARALGYAHENAVVRLFNRNKESFKERGSQIDSTCGLKEGYQIDNTLNCSELKYDTGVVEIDTPGGRQMIRYFTKRGALKICMKSNQPRAVQVQELLIDLFEDVESRRLVPASGVVESLAAMQQQLWQMTQQLAEIKRIVENSMRQALPGPRRKGYGTRAFDQEALQFIYQLFARGRTISEIYRSVQREAELNKWKVGSRATVYRLCKDLRGGLVLTKASHNGTSSRRK